MAYVCLEYVEYVNIFMQVAKSQFTDKQDPLDASLFYLAMKKQNVLKLLFKYVHTTVIPCVYMFL